MLHKSEAPNNAAVPRGGHETSSVVKRLLIGTTFGITVPVLYFYSLIPNVMSTTYVLLIAVSVSGGIALLRPRPGLAKAAAGVASCLLSLIVMDLALRPAINRQLLGPREMYMYYWPPMPTLWRYGTHVTFHQIISGDLAGTSRQHYEEKRLLDFETDAFGFRNCPRQVEGEHDKNYDLILLGDSVGVGVGTTQEKTWGTLLSRKYGLRTYNLSMPGSSPWHELMNLKIACQRLHCGSQTIVLWVMFAGNDLSDEYGDELEPSLVDNPVRRLRIAAKTFRNMSPIRNLVERVRQFYDPNGPQVIVKDLPGGKKLLFRKRYVDETRLTYDQVRQHPHYPKLMAVLDEMKRFADTEHFSVYVMVVPAKEEVYRWVLDGASAPVANTQASGFARAVGERCRLEGFPFLDMKPLLVAEANRLFMQSGRLLWWADDTHWNEIGHEYAASVTHDFLSSTPKSLSTAQAWTALPTTK